jgi:hypothetical protein
VIFAAFLWPRPLPNRAVAGQKPPQARLALMVELDRQKATVKKYDPRWRPSEKIPEDRGVCTDVILRGFRTLGVDIAAKVNADIRQKPKSYPYRTGDPSTDPRRCRNLIVWFKRHAPRGNGEFRPGDVVFWDSLQKGYATHVGFVGEGKDASGNRTVVHHGPGGAVKETADLYRWPILGHFRLPVVARVIGPE